MRRFLACCALILSAGCSTAVVESDGLSGTTSGSAGTGAHTGSSGTGTGGATTSSSSSSSTSSGAEGSCWDGNHGSGQGGPCGGNLLKPPPVCSAGLVCVQAVPDATGTCAPSGTMVSPEGGPCGGFTANPKICAWDATCLPAGIPDATGTCMVKSCPEASGCLAPLVTLDGDGLTKEFSGSCAGTETGSNAKAASGYIGYPAPHSTGPEQIWIAGCATAGGNPLQGSLEITGQQAMVGATMTASVTYDSGVDSYAAMGTATLTVTTLSADTIRGTYEAMVEQTNGNFMTQITGSFQVCRGPDFLPP